MASVDFVILSSSPARQTMVQNMSSSPQLPSPTEVFKRDSSALRSGTTAVPILDDLSSPFATTSVYFNQAAKPKAPKLVQPSHSDKPIVPRLAPGESNNAKAKGRGVRGATNCDEAKPSKKSRGPVQKDNIATPVTGAKKVSRPRGKTSEKITKESIDTKEVVTKKQTAKRSKKADTEGGVDEVSKQKKVRKPRASKADTNLQSKLANGKVTKSIAKKKALPEKPNGTEIVDLPSQSADADDFGLVEAVRRRVAWTPPKPTAGGFCTIPCSAGSLNSALASNSPSRPNGFSDLHGTFGFTSTGKSDGVIQTNGEVAMRKRKLIELVRTSTSDAAAQSKEKAVRKKARTITDQATSAYAPQETGSPVSAPLLQYFSGQPTGQVSDGFKVPSKSRPKNPIKKKTAADSKRIRAKASTLLSPESAMKQVGNQDFVFGTSSQLAREESPTFLRDIHEAMQASNEVHALDTLANPVEECSSSSFRRGKAVPSEKGVLWSAASRGVDGGFLDIEMVDLSESPAILKQAGPIFVEDSSDTTAEKLRELSPVENLRNDLTAERIAAEVLSLESSKLGPIETAIRAELLGSPLTMKATETEPSRSLKPLPQPMSKLQKPTPELSQGSAPKMPEFDTYTTVKLAKEIASYHFKPVKNRQNMIVLLQKCWEGKQRTALSALNANFATKSPAKTAKIPCPSPEKESPKRARGRPRKDSTVASPTKQVKARARSKNAHSVEYLEQDSDTPLSHVRTPRKPRKKSTSTPEEISDSETALTPSPPRRHASQIEGRPLPLPLKSHAKASPELSDIEARVVLFNHITNAIRNVSPSKDTEHPSWYEKILLYDPIILEDLAAWLNTGAMEKVGWDGEVAAWEVKKWCESKSICCLWKENLRGGTRSRY